MGLRGFEGQQELGSSLLFALSRGRLAHAYIFSGPQGAGKSPLALALAKAVLCRDSADGESCGRCQACLLVSQESHPDVEVFRPEDGKAAYPIKQVREEIRRRAYLKPALGPKRFLIIEQADALVRTSGSRNEVVDTLLKLLEEPAPDTVLILLTSRPERLPDTVLSRCQHARLKPPGAGHVARSLAESGTDPSEALFLAQLAGSDLTVARELLHGRKKDRPDTKAIRELLLNLARSLGELSYPDLLGAAAALEGYSRGWPALSGALGVLALLYRDAALIGAESTGVSLSFTGGPEEVVTRELAARCDPALLRAMSLRALKAQEDSRRFPARLLLLEVLFLDLRAMLEGSPGFAARETRAVDSGSLGVS